MNWRESYRCGCTMPGKNSSQWRTNLLTAVVINVILLIVIYNPSLFMNNERSDVNNIMRYNV